MEVLVVLVLVGVIAWVVAKFIKFPEANNDGVVDHKDVVEAAKEVVAEVKAEAVKVADVNADGKVDLADVKVAAENVAKKVKKGRKKKAE